MRIENRDKKLVTIIVVTYNSSSFILETLESVKNQSYSQIELIISDDCSRDNTVNICKDWLEQNKHRFIRTQLIESKFNTGVSINCNRGLEQSKGNWIKFLAGDDLLLEDSIQDFIKYCLNQNNCKVVFGNTLTLKNGIITQRPTKKIHFAPYKDQKKLIYTGHLPFAPALFINKDLLLRLGGFDERYLFMEDYPFYLKLANEKIRMHFITENVVIHRIHSHNISSNFLFIEDYENFVSTEILPYLKKKKYFEPYLYFQNIMFIRRVNLKLKNRYPKLSKVLPHLVMRNSIETLALKIKNKE